MQPHLAKRSIAASQLKLDAKLELLQQLGYDSNNRFFSDEDDHVAPLSEKSAYLDHDTDRWIQTEYNWALEEAADPTIGIPDLFDVEEEDEEACLPYVYDPTFFGARPSAPSTPRARSQSLTQPVRSGYDKPLPVPPLRLRPRPSLPLVPPPTPAKAQFASPDSSIPHAPRSLLSERKQTPPPSPRLSSRLSSSPKPRPFPRTHTPSASASQPARPNTQRHATYPSISSTMSMLEERETETEKRSAVYVADEEVVPPRASPKLAGRGRSSSAALPRTTDDFGHGPHTISSSPRRKQRPTLPTLTTSHSTPQLRNLAELATMPSPALAPAPTLLPSLMSDARATADPEVVSPGEAITCSPLDSPADEEAEAALASRWSLDSVASRPRIRQVPADVSSSPASKSKKRDRLLSLISGRQRAGSVGKPSPPPNTPRGSSDVLDIRRSSSRETTHSPSRPSFSMSILPPRALAPSVSSSSSSGGSTASTLATPIEPTSHSPLPDMDPFGTSAPSCMFEDELVFAANPYITPESPLLAPQNPQTPPSPPCASLTLQIPSRPGTPNSPPLQPTLPLPSPSTPSPSFLVPAPRSQSFFASFKGRQRRRRKKLVISGAPLELALSRASSSVSPMEATEDVEHRAVEQQRRVDNVIRWCESFGPTRKIERKEDGSLHVYWKEWEVADTVCRIQAQVVIKDVGRVNLAWSYIS